VSSRKSLALVKIGQLEHTLGVSKSKLNYYITCELIKPTDRSPSGQRLFDLDDVRGRLEKIDNYKKQGKSIEDIRKLFNDNKRK